MHGTSALCGARRRAMPRAPGGKKGDARWKKKGFNRYRRAEDAATPRGACHGARAAPPFAGIPGIIYFICVRELRRARTGLRSMARGVRKGSDKAGESFLVSQFR